VRVAVDEHGELTYEVTPVVRDAGFSIRPVTAAATRTDAMRGEPVS
jgi:hypothetical protein